MPRHVRNGSDLTWVRRPRSLIIYSAFPCVNGVGGGNKQIGESDSLAQPTDMISSPKSRSNILNSPLSSTRHDNIMTQSEIIDADVTRLCRTPPPFNNQQHRSTQPSHQAANTPTPSPSIQRAIEKSPSALSSSYNNTQSDLSKKIYDNNKEEKF